MGIYDRITTVKAAQGGSRLDYGNYLLQVVAVKENQNAKGVFFVVETRIVTSDNAACPPGSEGSCVIKMNGQYPDSALADVKALVAPMLGIDPADPRADVEVTPQVIAGVIHPTNPLAGTFISVRVWSKKPGDPAAFKHWAASPVIGADGKPRREALPQRSAPPPAGAFAPPSPVAPAAAPPPYAPPPPVAPPFPPPGWTAHPQYPGYFYCGQECLSEAQLRAR